MDHNNLKPREILMAMGERWWTAMDVHDRFEIPEWGAVPEVLSWLHAHGYVDMDDTSSPRRYRRNDKIWPAGRGDT